MLHLSPAFYFMWSTSGLRKKVLRAAIIWQGGALQEKISSAQAILFVIERAHSANRIISCAHPEAPTFITQEKREDLIFLA
jgi:hypothetical protein